MNRNCYERNDRYQNECFSDRVRVAFEKSRQSVSKRRKIRVDQAETRVGLRGGGGLTLKISKAERRKREM